MWPNLFFIIIITIFDSTLGSFLKAYLCMSSVSRQGERQHGQHRRKEQRRTRRSAPSLRLYARLWRLGSLPHSFKASSSGRWWNFLMETPRFHPNSPKSDVKVACGSWIFGFHGDWPWLPDDRSTEAVKTEMRIIPLLIPKVFQTLQTVTWTLFDTWVAQKHFHSNSHISGFAGKTARPFGNH